MPIAIQTICIHHFLTSATLTADAVSPFILYSIGVFLAGGIYGALIFLVRVIKSESSLQKELDKNSSEEIVSGVPVRILDGVGMPSAFTSGLKSPRIYLTRVLFDSVDPETLDIIIQHERGHLTRHDPYRYTVLTAMSKMFWFIPSVVQIIRKSKLRAEIFCDSLAMKKGYSANKIAEALLMVASMEPLPANQTYACLSSYDDMIEERVKILLGIKVRRFSFVTVAAVFVSLIMSFAIAGSVSAGILKTYNPNGIHSTLTGLTQQCESGMDEGTVFGMVCPHCSGDEEVVKSSVCTHHQK